MRIVVESHTYSTRWPPGQDTAVVRIVAGLDDPKGLGGLELRIGGDLPTRTFAAIVDEAANYEDEALWVTLYRAHPDECLDDCSGWW